MNSFCITEKGSVLLHYKSQTMFLHLSVWVGDWDDNLK